MNLFDVVINKLFTLSYCIMSVILPKSRFAKLCGVKIGVNNMISSIFWSPSEPYLIKVGSNCQITEGVKFFTHGGGGRLGAFSQILIVLVKLK